MAVSSSEFRSRARQKLNAHYWDALLAVIVEGALLSVGSPVAIIIGGALVIGLASFFLHNADRQNADITDLFAPFSKQFGNSIVYFILFFRTCLFHSGRVFSLFPALSRLFPIQWLRIFSPSTPK